jgi:hypothetical protein
MATLTGRAPKDTYGDLLQVSNANDGVDSTLRFLSDGKGTNSSFKISSSDAQFTSTLTSTGLLTTTAGIVSGSDIISDTDSTDDLGSTGVRWANLWVDNITMGGTIAGAVATFSSTLTVTGLTTIASLKGTGAVTITDILDEDNMASDSATVLATQQSIKAYVDAQVGTVDTLSEVLAIGNTSGATDLVMDSGQKVTTNTIDETTAASGVTIDSVLVKDSTVTAGTLTIGAGSITDSSGAISFGNENLVTTGTLGCGALTSTGIDDNATSTQLTISDSASTFAGDITLDATSLGSTVRFIPAVNTSLSTIRFDEAAGTQRASLDFLSNTGDMFIKSGTSGWGGTIDLWTNGVTALKIDTSQDATFAGSIDVGNDADVTGSATTGYIKLNGNAYNGWISMDASSLHIGHNTSARNLVLETNSTDALTIDGSQNATFAGDVSVNSATGIFYNSSTGNEPFLVSNNSGSTYFMGMRTSAVGNNAIEIGRLTSQTAWSATTATFSSDGTSTFAGKIATGTGSGATASANADDIVIDGTGHTGITISSGASSQGAIFFGDTGANERGQIFYDHSSNTMYLYTNGTQAVNGGYISGVTSGYKTATSNGDWSIGGDAAGGMNFSSLGSSLAYEFRSGGTSIFNIGNTGNATFGGTLQVIGGISTNGGSATIKQGNGSPEGAITAVVGSIWMQINGGAGSTLYVKESGTGNTGWSSVS